MTSPVRTTCPYCGTGCGVLVSRSPTGITVEGDPDHPANFGRLCSKGSALAQTIGMRGRLLTPRIAGHKATWDDALSLVARRFSETIARHGPDAVAFYVSGQLLTEDYYAANKLMKGFIGSGNIDTNSRLCMASSVAGHRRAFGSDTVPGLYEDLELADLVVLTGSNLAWCHPVLYQRLLAAKSARPEMRVVVIDPRRTATCEIADLHLPLAPGSDAALFNALLAASAERGLANAAFLDNLTGAGAAIAAAAATDPALTGLDPALLVQFTDLWCSTEKVVTVYSQGINQSATGTDKVNAILNCHLLTGRIGHPGMGPFSITGQPNAMGGREVGGLSNMLACHLAIENPVHRAAVQDFWHSPRMASGPGLKAIEMFDAIEDGRIKALWIMSTNPAMSMPQADRVARIIANCDFTVVSDVMADTDTTRLADVLLPAAAWGEKDGTVTNSERRISRQRAFRAAPAQTMPDWKIISEVTARMGWGEAFAWTRPAQIFAEYAELSGLAGRMGSDFDISGWDQDYEAMQPTLWPQSKARQGGRFFGDGRFHTPDGKARMIPVTPEIAPARPGQLRLNTGRIRDQWHSMTRTGLSPRLSGHIAEPFLEVHPDDALRLGLQPAGLAQLSNGHGTAILRVLVTDRAAAGQVFAPMHWSGRNSAAGRVDALVTGPTDPHSGQPALKEAAVTVLPFRAAWYGFAVAAHDFRPECDYWATARTETGLRAELAGAARLTDPEGFARDLFDLPEAEAQTVSDIAKGRHHIALSENGIIRAALFIAPEPVALSRDFVARRVGHDAPQLIAGRPGADMPDPGALVCACFDIGANTIITAIREGRARTVDQIGQALRAGTNCGSCRSQIAGILSQERPPAIAAE
ncbi:nitrate reductase [Paracoccus sp. M683]|uniref:nitrate reductase n=1 Tax=Paracoccus sp. M683 TaxID=2594268 RepID=UPI00117D11D5|nr:nitrate reductase [Paracoccus sp. M683]TRW95458.1 nitrate reductase [Paracoccus sp. M683]